MYIVEIVNRETKKKLVAGPTIFTGDRGETSSLTEARAKMQRWISENMKTPENWCVVSQLVGCL